MRVFISGAILLISPLAILGAPCAPGDLQSYVNLGSTGCDLGDRLFANFTLGPVPPFPTMDSTVVNVDPGGTSVQPELLFTPNYTAAPGQAFGLLFDFILTGALTGVSLEFHSPTTSGDGVVYAYLDVCADGFFTPYAPFGCTPGLPFLLARAGLGNDQPQDLMLLPNAAFYNVSLHLYLEAHSGSASLNSATIAFNTVSEPVNAVPEPPVTPIMLAGLAVASLCRWKHRWRAGHLIRRQ